MKKMTVAFVAIMVLCGIYVSAAVAFTVADNDNVVHVNNSVGTSAEGPDFSDVDEKLEQLNANIRETSRDQRKIARDQELTASGLWETFRVAVTNTRTIHALKESIDSLIGKFGESITSVNNLTIVVRGMQKNINQNIKRQSDLIGFQNAKNTWLLGVLIVVGVVLIILVIFFVTKDLREDAKVISKSAKDIMLFSSDLSPFMKDVSDDIGGLRGDVKDISAKIDKAAAFDASPIELKLSGRVVGRYYLSDEETEGKFYYTFQVEDVGDGNPENFERQIVSKRGKAAGYMAGTIKRYHKGTLKGTPREDLIKYLVASKKLEII